GWNASLASIRVQISSRRVAAASAASSMLVRPEDSGPQTSVRHPRGRPSLRASTCAIPQETVSGAGRISRREAAVTPVSLDVRESCFKRATDLGSATKGKQRPSASMRTSEEDIGSSKKSGNAGGESLASGEGQSSVVSLFI